MALKYKHRLLFVDDEESITKALYRVFRREGYETHSALSGQEGLALLKEAGKSFSLIISDQRMPGMTGAQFLEKAKKIFPDAMRILLTGYSDVDAIVDAVNKGEIHRYFTKPWNDDDLLIQIRHALEQYELKVENRRLIALTRRKNMELRELNELLEEKVAERSREIIEKNTKLARLNKDLESSFYDTVRAFGSLVEMHHPVLAGHGRRVSILSRMIAQLLDLSENEATHIEIAALLHDIGKLGFPKKLLEYNENKWSPQEKELFRKHPNMGQETVQFINKLDHIGIMIRCHHEQYNGHGYPGQLAEEEIPLGSRIIAVADVYDKIFNLNVEIDKSMKEIKEEISKTQDDLTDDEVLEKTAIHHLEHNAFTRYDPEIVKVFLSLIKTRGGLYKGEKELSIEHLKEGMVLSRPLYSSSGRFLLSASTIIADNYLSKLNALHMRDPINDVIYVIRQGEKSIK